MISNQCRFCDGFLYKDEDYSYNSFENEVVYLTCNCPFYDQMNYKFNNNIILEESLVNKNFSILNRFAERQSHVLVPRRIEEDNRYISFDFFIKSYDHALLLLSLI